MKQKPIVRFFPFLLLISLVFGCISLISSISSTMKQQNAKEEREKILLALQQREAELQKTLEFTRSPEFIESEARTKLNMARSGETIILIDQTHKNAETLEKTDTRTNWKIWWELFF